MKLIYKKSISAERSEVSIPGWPSVGKNGHKYHYSVVIASMHRRHGMYGLLLSVRLSYQSHVLAKRPTRVGLVLDRSIYQLLGYSDDVDLNRKLAEWEHFYNLDRPYGAHAGTTPYEALRSILN